MVKRKRRLGFTLKIQGKLILAVLCLAIIPTLFVGLFATYRFTNSLQSNTYAYSQQILNKTSHRLQDTINDYRDFSNEILFHPSVQNGLHEFENLGIMERRGLIKDIAEYCHNRYNILQYLTEAEVITTSGEVFYTSGYTTISEESFQRLMEKADQLGGRLGWEYIDLKDKNNIAIYRQLKSEETKKVIGYFILVVSEEALLTLYGDVDMGEDSSVFIVDQDGFILSTTDSSLKVGNTYGHKALMDHVFTYRNKDTIINLDDKDYIVNYNLLNDEKWALVSLIPHRNFKKQSQEILENMLYVIGIVILIIILFSIVISKHIWLPLQDLVNHMKQVEKGDFGVRVSYKKDDEIGYLNKSFENMVNRIEVLMQETEKKQKEKNEMEIKMLQAQINPHFLFNTLNSLKWTAKISQVNSLSEGLGALAKILKSTILHKDPFIRLEDELENIRHYGTIQELRYGNSFMIDYDVDEKLLKSKVLKFLLQPLVENAIIHGGGREDEQLIILIRVKEEESNLCIDIEDNGEGMSQDKVKALLEEESYVKGKVTSMGVKNVHQRIQLNHGKAYGLHIESELNKGTHIRIMLPLINEEE